MRAWGAYRSRRRCAAWSARTVNDSLLGDGAERRRPKIKVARCDFNPVALCSAAPGRALRPVPNEGARRSIAPERGGVASGFDSPCPPSYLAGMPPRRRTSKDTPAKLAKRMSRRWRVVLLRAKGEILGTVEAPDVAAAKAAAAVQFNLDDVQRNRIMVQELA
jgi:hypothetical protein